MKAAVAIASGFLASCNCAGYFYGNSGEWGDDQFGNRIFSVKGGHDRTEKKNACDSTYVFYYPKDEVEEACKLPFGGGCKASVPIWKYKLKEGAEQRVPSGDWRRRKH